MDTQERKEVNFSDSEAEGRAESPRPYSSGLGDIVRASRPAVFGAMDESALLIQKLEKDLKKAKRQLDRANLEIEIVMNRKTYEDKDKKINLLTAKLLSLESRLAPDYQQNISRKRKAPRDRDDNEDERDAE